MREETTTGPAELDRIAAPLFVPATHPERFGKALNSMADSVIIDLEDAVAVSEKEAARDVLSREVSRLPPHRQLLGVRVNGAGTDEIDRDSELVDELGDRLDFVVLPEARSTDDLQRLQELLTGTSPQSSLPVLALIESSQGLLNAPSIAQFPIVKRLALGAADLSEEWEIEPSPEETEFDYARQQLVVASRAAGLRGPIDSPHMNVRDADGLKRRLLAVLRLGMKGKLCIHPKQVEPVLRNFVISTEEYRRLRELAGAFEAAESAGESSMRLQDGAFIDYPVYRRAKKQIELYEQFHSGE